MHLPGPYKFDNFAVHARIVATNKVPNAPYRGAGRPEATFAMERTMDLIAGELGLDPADVRLRNMIPHEEMPYRLGIPYRDGEPIVYDSGDYPKAAAAGARRRSAASRRSASRQNEARAQGRYLGLGLGCYVEGTGVGPFESATVRIDPTGKVYVASGACPQGQGMETIFSQVVADAWKVKPDDVVMALADTSAISIGFGTIASRSTVTLSAAIHYASEILREKVFAIAANMLECAPGDLELRNGTIGVVGVPGNEVTLASVAKAARPGWDHGRPPGMEAGLEETYYYEPPTVTWSYAVARGHRRSRHQDRAARHREIRHRPRLRRGGEPDAGRRPDPRRHRAGLRRRAAGGIRLRLRGPAAHRLVHGLSAADRERHPACRADPSAFASPLNPLGVKGVGEGSAISPPVVIANAVSDALAPFKMEFNSTPIKPEQIAAASLSAADRKPRPQ